MIAFRTSALLIAAIAGGLLLQPSRAPAQWWGARAPADFEECADSAEKVESKEARTAALSECNAKFAGRRKPGGGYSYFDFMQNRNFDIAGPNPTPEEQKQIDEQRRIAKIEKREMSLRASQTPGPYAGENVDEIEDEGAHDDLPSRQGTPSVEDKKAKRELSMPAPTTRT